MSLQKGAMANQTTMSLDERFTQLRRAESTTGMRVGARARIESRILTATAKNRRLALQMARRPAVIAALSFRRGRGMQRSLPGNSVSTGASRFGRTNPIRGSFRSLRGRGTQRLGRLSRSQSLQSLTGRVSGGSLNGRIGGQQALGGRIGATPQSLSGRIGVGLSRGRGLVRGRGRGRLFRSNSVSRFNTNRNDNTNRRGTFRGRGSRGGSFRRGTGLGRGRGRGGRGGRGGGRGANKNTVPNKETLDKELDQYMSASKVALDKEIDQYMNEPEENWD